MNIKFDEIIKDANTLPQVPLKGITAYQENISGMKKYVNDKLTTHPDINKLIGNNPIRVMYDNHSNHTAFMFTVFTLGNYELLVRTVFWVYRAYAAHNFSYDYFPLELKTWVEAIDKYIPDSQNQEIKKVYSWMIENHELMIELSQADIEVPLPMKDDWFEVKNSFFAAILKGDHKACVHIAKDAVSTSEDVESFYLYIIQPVMYEIGMLWERGEISVAQEHLASAIVARVMATINMLDITPEITKSKVIVTAAPNEFHEIGAWMIADIVEQNGWDVKYLGANTPKEGLLEMLRTSKTNILMLSVTMPFNILNAKDIISSIREDEELNKTIIVVGGRAFNDTEKLWESTGADYFAPNAHDVKELLNKVA